MTKKRKFLLEKITEIKAVGKKECYDLTVPDNHNFFANNILVHNSGSLEESADSCILLHNNYLYSFDHKDYGKIEVAIAKNRHGRTGATTLSWYPEIMMFGQKVITIGGHD